MRVVGRPVDYSHMGQCADPPYPNRKNNAELDNEQRWLRDLQAPQQPQ